MMKRFLILAVACMVVPVFLGGCAAVTNIRRREDGSEKHMFSILGIPLWMSETPIDESAGKE